MGILMMNSIGWPYDSSDCLSYKIPLDGIFNYFLGFCFTVFCDSHDYHNTFFCAKRTLVCHL